MHKSQPLFVYVYPICIFECKIYKRTNEIYKPQPP